MRPRYVRLPLVALLRNAKTSPGFLLLRSAFSSLSLLSHSTGFLDLVLTLFLGVLSLSIISPGFRFQLNFHPYFENLKGFDFRSFGQSGNRSH